MSQSRSAEIDASLRIAEATGHLLRSPGWAQWLKPWLEAEMKKRWEVLRKGDAEAVRRAQIELDILEEIVEKPGKDHEVNAGLLRK